MSQPKNQAIVKGSIRDLASRRGLTIAEAFIDAELIVIVDSSGTMAIADASGGRMRFAVACEQLARLQNNSPGKVAVISFSDNAVFCPSGLPDFLQSGTDMLAALRFAHPADGTGIRLVLISDGLPDNPDATLKEAARFTSRIDTIYIGPEGGEGATFLRRLAAATGGSSTSQGAEELNLLGKTIQRLLAS